MLQEDQGASSAADFINNVKAELDRRNSKVLAEQIKVEATLLALTMQFLAAS